MVVLGVLILTSWFYQGRLRTRFMFTEDNFYTRARMNDESNSLLVVRGFRRSL